MHDRPLVIAVRAKPGASRDRVGGAYEGPRGRALVVAVRARAQGGAANRAIARALAGAFGLKPSSIELESGHGRRDKLYSVADPPADLPQRLQKLLDRSPERSSGRIRRRSL